MNTSSSPRLGAALALLCLATVAQAADINGDWSWTTPGRNGGPDRTTMLTLKAEGAKLTGKVAAPNRDGKEVETPISDGKVDGDSVAFSVIRENNGTTITAKYSGKVSADKLADKIEITRDGQPQSRDWEAKRVAATKW